MAWFNKSADCGAVAFCPVIDKLIKDEARKRAMSYSGHSSESNVSDYNRDLLEVQFEERFIAADKEICSVKADISKIKDVINLTELLERPSNLSALMIRINCLENQEKELSARLRMQNRAIALLTGRLEKLENKKDVTINIVNKTDEPKLE